jgi:hypothetical protein
MEVKVAGSPTGWKVYGPQDIYGDYDVRVQAGEESLNRQQKRAEAVAVANALAPYVQIYPGLVKPIVQKIGDAYGWENIDQILAEAVRPTPQMPPASPQLPQGPSQFQNGNGELLPQPALATLAGNAR